MFVYFCIITYMIFMKLKIKEIIKEKGTTMSEVAEKIGTKQAALSRAISDDGNPTLSLLTRTADALGVPITELFENDGIVGFVKVKGNTYEINSIADIEKLLQEIKG